MKKGKTAESIQMKFEHTDSLGREKVHKVLLIRRKGGYETPDCMEVVPS